MTLKSRYSSSSNYFLPLTIVFLSTAAVSSSPIISYDDVCGSVVPQYLSTNTSLSPSKFLIFNGHFSGGKKLFALEAGSSSHFTDHSSVGSFSFSASYIHEAKLPQILQLRGSLSFKRYPNIVMRRSLRSHQSNIQSIFADTIKYVQFELSGYWSESTGMICMVGTGSSDTYDGNPRHYSAVLKLHYPVISNIFTSIVSGTVESLDRVDSLSYFENISVSAYSQKNYSYMDFPPSIRNSCLNQQVPKETRSFDMDSLGFDIPNLLAVSLRLEHGNDCSGENCNPFSLKYGSVPTLLRLSQIYFSEEGKFHTRIKFFNHITNRLKYFFEPEDSLVGEGFWDHEKNQLCLVACQVLANASVGDCTVGLSLWFPLALTIKSRSRVMGSLWSNKNKNDPDYFSTMLFRDISGSYMSLDRSLKYKYSVLNGATRCDAVKSSSDIASRAYPDGSSRQDLTISMFSMKRWESSARGHAYPISIGDTVLIDSFGDAPMGSLNDTLLKVSYEISYWIYANFSYHDRKNDSYWRYSNMSSPVINTTEISAEGLYNSMNGQLCMVGCKYDSSSILNKQARTEDSLDCNILINIQFPPIDPKEGEHLHVTIKSTRQASDPLYFRPLLFTSDKMYDKQAIALIGRMDLEILMVVISLTLSCIFIRLQILYAKKNQDVLPAISITMLGVMTLGYLLPLILNFESVIGINQYKQNPFLRNSEWIMVKEVVVRVLTLVAFILHLCMLQLACSARGSSEGKKDLSVAELKTMKLCSVLYFAGAVISWFAQSKIHSQRWKWEDLISYVGFILDGFLFPQIMFNLFRRSNEKALSLAFYTGMTAIRIFPHFYDLYRSNVALPHFQFSYIFANPEVDFYSLSWNIVIPLAGIVFATFIYMQQRFGGDCILPSTFRKQRGYVAIGELGL